MTEELHEIVNFRVVSPGLATGGQPTEEQLRAVGDSGFEVVINLGLADAPYALADEAATVAESGMHYHHRPVDFQNPTPADFAHFRALMRRHRARKIFVHCAANYRVSTFIGLYGMAELGWSGDDVEAFVARTWQPDPVWRAFLRQIKESIVLEQAS